MSEVTITNVGRDGVASEATLQALANKFERSGKLDKENLRTLEKFGKEAKSSGEELGKLANAAKKAKEGLANLAKEAAFGGTRATDFAEALFGASNMVTRLVSYGDELVDTFRTLSSVGGSLNNNIFDLVTYSAESALSLDQFSEMVRDNSETLAMLGGTVSEGARRFATMSRELRTGFGADLFNMGFTIEELNDGLLDYIELERSRSFQNIRSDRELTMSANEYMKSLDALAKITGKQRKEIADAMAQQNTEARIRAQLNRLTDDEAKNLTEGLAFLDTELQGPFADALRDLLDGTPQTELGKALANQIPNITQFAQSMYAGQLSVDEVQKRLAEMAPRFQTMISSMTPAQLQAMEQSSNGTVSAIAQLYNASYQLNRLQERNTDAALAEQKKRETITSLFTQFEQVVKDFRTEFVRFLTDVFGEGGKGAPFIQALKDATTEIGKLIGPAGKDGFKGLKSILEEATKSITPLFGEKGIFTTGVQSFTKWINEGGIQKSIESATAKLTEFGNYLTSTFYNDGKFELFQGLRKIFDAALDGIVNILVGGGDDTGGSTGLIDRIFAKITGGMDSATGGGSLFQKVVDSASIVFDSIFDSFKKLVFGPKTDTKKSITDLLTEKAGSLYDEFKKRVFGEGAEKQSLGDLLIAEFDKFVNSLSTSLTKIDKKLGEVLGLGEGKTFSDVLMEWLTTATNKVAITFKEHMPDIAKALADGLEKNAEVIGKALGTVINNLSSTVRAGASSTVAEEQKQGYLERAARSLTGTTAEDRAKNFVKEYMKTNNVSKEEAVNKWSGGEAKLLFEQWKKEGRKGPVSGMDRVNEIKESLLKNQLYTGTGGKFVDFGSGTPAMLHGREMVIPENDIGTAVQALTRSSVNGNVDTMKQLNSNVQVMIKLLATQNAISNQQLRATKGMGNDYYRGVMR